ncbi:MAG: ABC transporter permease [Firmicutes bacterium]|nr:ABC transporter permease [Bacillota bacterium]
MTVFKTILKIINKLKGMIILYTVMLVSITLLNQTSNTNVTNFEESKPDILIVNKDTNDKLTNGFIKYLKKHSNVKKIKEDKIDDAIFYRDINYVVYIPDSFSSDILNGKKPIIDYKASGDYYSSYTQMLIEKYIKIALIYKDYYKDDELVNKINKTVESNIKVEMTTKLDTNALNITTVFFNFLNYAFLAGCVYSISMVLSILKEKNVYKRTIISSYNFKKYNSIVLLTNFFVIFAMYIIYMILSIILFKKIMFTTNGIMFMINSFIFMLCALSIGFLIGNITQNKNAIGGIVNVVALGTSFLCGCFVPIEYLPDYVINISKILPTHYFVMNNELIKTLEVFDYKNIKPLIQNSLVLIGFTIGFIILTKLLSKKKNI